jgi:hypothetical protein
MMISHRCARQKGGLEYFNNHPKTFYSEGARKPEQRSITIIRSRARA